ncbi:MAG: hypothetical protein AAGG68_24955, partial [Bacteroidota bacterium]
MNSQINSRTNIERYSDTLMSMCLDFKMGGIDEETFVANLNGFNEALNSNYDSTSDTLLHIKRVNQLLTGSAIELIARVNSFDSSCLFA